LNDENRPASLPVENFRTLLESALGVHGLPADDSQGEAQAAITKR